MRVVPFDLASQFETVLVVYAIAVCRLGLGGALALRLNLWAFVVEASRGSLLTLAALNSVGDGGAFARGGIAVHDAFVVALKGDVVFIGLGAEGVLAEAESEAGEESQ